MAPLSGYTDLPFRTAARRCGARFCFTEMIDAAALVYARRRTERMLVRGGGEDWLGVQLVSNSAEHIGAAVDILNGYDFDLLDFNLGCPVPKVVKKGAGAALGKNIDRACELFGILAERSRTPVSCKLRILDFKDPEPTAEIVRRLVERGACAVTIHGRLAEDFYSGPVAFPVIEACAAAVDAPIIANGGIMGRGGFEAAKVGVPSAHGFMIARGAMGNPWIFRELADGAEFVPPTIAELVAMAKLHVGEMLRFYGEAKGSALARKIVLDYFRGRGFNGEWRGKAGLLNGETEFMDYLDSAARNHSADYWKTPPVDRRLAATV
ncbi:MAG: tRNA-dihydrouridine synthase family protein [Victivallaceae bacterium]|nr:tRNA-dihydrouridine synthase family protein [Victivallaceae bacterium]